MEYLYYQRRMHLKMSKIDSETKKNYSNEHPSKVMVAGIFGKTKIKGLSKEEEDKFLKKIRKIELNTEKKLKLKKFKPKDFIKIKD